MLPPAALDAADRLITTLMTLIDALAPIALARNLSTLPAHVAPTLALRLINLITTLIRISNFGIRTRAAPTTPPDPIHRAPTARPSPTQGLPRHPGWLLAALPDIAPAIAADLAALLADPALATLLSAAPTLHRALRPLLRSLDLAALQPPPSPSTPSPAQPPAQPGPPLPHGAPLPSQPAAPKSTPLNSPFLTPNSLRYSNKYHTPRLPLITPATRQAAFHHKQFVKRAEL